MKNPFPEKITADRLYKTLLNSEATYAAHAINQHDKLVTKLQKVHDWLIRNAENHERFAEKETRWMSLAEEYSRDAKNYRATAKDIAALLAAEEEE